MIRALKHENLVRLLGLVIDDKSGWSKIYLVTEFMGRGESDPRLDNGKVR